MPSTSFIQPDWPAPGRVRAASTTRRGGVSGGPWRGLNLATHCGDAAADVWRNRDLLRRALGLPTEPVWLEQVHGCDVRRLPSPDDPADAVWTTTPGVVCTILTADCLPVLLCDRGGGMVAAAHAGWRGLAAGVLETTLQALPVEPCRLMAWLGPCIGPDAFEVGEDVRSAFCSGTPIARAAFKPARRPAHWFADLARLARDRLMAAGVEDIHGGIWDTFSDPLRFYSYRRDGRTGRMATMIWLEA
ncbi:MAG TPA: peptidoglycan editing factor PgeF [Nevskiaceae bacterium]